MRVSERKPILPSSLGWLVPVLAVALLLSPRCSGRKTEEELIRETLEEISRAVEAKDIEAVMARLAPEYTDFRGRTRSQTREMVKAHFQQFRGIVMHILGIRMEELTASRASLEADVALSSGAARALRKWIPFSTDNYRFRIRLEKRDRVWRITFAEWRSIGMEDLFPESLNILEKLFPVRRYGSGATPWQGGNSPSLKEGQNDIMKESSNPEGGRIPMDIQLKSPAFEEGGMIPSRFTCDGPDLSPPLAWTSVPPEAKTLALVCDDPDAPMGTWVHWVIFNIPVSQTGLEEGIPKDERLPGGALQGKNDFRRIGYGGPCPPGGTHRYFFKIYALDTELELRPGCTKAELLAAMEGHILAKGQLMGRYSR